MCPVEIFTVSTFFHLSHWTFLKNKTCPSSQIGLCSKYVFESLRVFAKEALPKNQRVNELKILHDTESTFRAIGKNRQKQRRRMAIQGHL